MVEIKNSASKARRFFQKQTIRGQHVLASQCPQMRRRGRKMEKGDNTCKIQEINIRPEKSLEDLQKEHQEVLELLKSCKPMERDAARWEKCVIADLEYPEICLGAEAWAQLIQQEMDNGQQLWDVVDKCHELANRLYNISGARRRAVTDVMIYSWTHGDQFMRWHKAQPI